MTVLQTVADSTQLHNQKATCADGPLSLAPPLAPFEKIDPALALVIASWPTLPEALKRAMLAMVDAVG